MAKEMGISQIDCYGDSDLVVQQCNGLWDKLDPTMVEYARMVDKIGAHFTGFEFHHIERKYNEAADALARIGSKRETVGPGVFLEHLLRPSVKVKSEAVPGNAPDEDSTLVGVFVEKPD